MTESHSPVPERRGKPSPILIVFLIFPILGLIAAAGLALSDINSSSAPTPAPVLLGQTSLIGKSAPNFELTGLNGERYRLSNYRGKVVFLNFWATWCEPCKRELPTFTEFSEGDQADEAVILAVNLDETPAAINEYFEEYGIRGITVLLDEDLNVQQIYGARQFPTTYVIDPAGVVRYMHLGEISESDLHNYVSEVGTTADES